MGSLTKALIGKEDCDVQDDELYPSTFSRLNSTGSTINLTSFPDVWKTHQDIINARSYSAGTKVGATIAAAIAAGTTSRSIYLEAGEWVISSNHDWSSYTTTQWIFSAGAYLTLNAGVTVTFPSPSSIIAQPNQKIFSGTGAVAFSKGGVSYPHWWGATGDGSTDDSTAVQAAITASEGGTLDFGDSEYSYVITSQLTVLSNTHIIGRGCTIDASGLTGTTPAVFTAAGSADGTGVSISSGADIDSYSIVTAAAPGVVADDLVLVTSDDHISITGCNQDYGEILTVRSVAGTTVNFTTPLSYTYSTTPILRSVTWKEDVHFKGIRILGDNSNTQNLKGIALRYVKRFSVQDCVLDGIGYYNVEVSACCIGDVKNNSIHGVYYDGVTGSNFFGIWLADCTQYVNVIGNRGDVNRHLVVTSAKGATGFYGQPQYCVISNNIQYDSATNDAGRSYAYDCHGYGFHNIWSNNVANGCYAGIRIEHGSFCVFTGNVIKNYAYAGILVGGTGTGGSNIEISNNEIMGMTEELGANAAAGIYIQATSATYNNLKINGNVIRDPQNDTAFFSGIYVTANVAFRNCTIENNSIYNSVESSAYQIYLAADSGINTTDNWTIQNNAIYGSKNGIAAFGDRNVIQGNTVRNSAAALTGYGVYGNGTNSVIKGNTFVYINTGIRIDSSSRGNQVYDNATIDCTATTSIHADAVATTVLAPATITAHIAGAEMHYDV